MAGLNQTTVMQLVYKRPNASIFVPAILANSKFANMFVRFFTGIANGSNPGIVSCSPGAVAASVALTLTGQPSAADTLTVGQVTLTAVASGATGPQFNIGSTAAITAANIAAAYNAQAGAANAVVASVNGLVVKFTAFYAGNMGNSIAASEALTNATLSGAFLAGGTDGSIQTYHYGA